MDEYIKYITSILRKFLPDTQFIFVPRKNYLTVKKIIEGKSPILFAYLDTNKIEFLENLDKMLIQLCNHSNYDYPTSKKIDEEKNNIMQYVFNSIRI